ncbi:alpha-amylase family glycosyl hydrolase [Aerophototrophica crusticola]|uniref:alpha-amylase family glycosyl hydrolase n=1 Tax=Aerophototrophica crusticola TaxID=1709002 RepID=UPI00384AAB34
MADRPETGAPPDRVAHAMPFGAEVRPDGTTRFRLWAPSVEGVELVLGEGAQERVHAMEPQGEGWFEAVRPAPAGCHYRFQLPDGMRVPDPASRHQAQDVHGPSTVIDPRAYRWRMPGFPGRPWEETVLYELHVGTFTPEGTFAAIQDKLDHLEMLGVTAVELMPVADFPGRRGWGYDGVLPFAPEAAYGTPDELKALVDCIHERGMTVFLDVVYNHFGPEGNYLHAYAKPFFGGGDTPWGPAIDYGQRPVRDFALHNALYWLEEYRFDGLRLDAVQEIRDASDPDLLDELAALVRERFPDRHVHLVLENDLNSARRLDRGKHGKVKRYAGQWNDDWHHAAQALLTGEDGGYYQDVHPDPAATLVKAATDGFAYQGSPAPGGTANPAANPAPTCRPPPSSTTCRTTTRWATGPGATGW